MDCKNQKKEWSIPLLDTLGIVRTLGGNFTNPESATEQPDGSSGGGSGG